MIDEEQIKRDIRIICKCKAVRFKTIRTAILQGATTLAQVRKTTHANTGCGQNCTEEILEMIKTYAAEGSQRK